MNVRPQISEFEQSLDDMLYVAYADGRNDERDEIEKMVMERAGQVPAGDRRAYADVLMLLLGRAPTPLTAQEAA